MCVGSDEKDVEQVLWCVYVISRVRCALGCVYCWPYCFCTERFGLMLGVSTLQILFLHYFTLYVTLPLYTTGTLSVCTCWTFCSMNISARSWWAAHAPSSSTTSSCSTGSTTTGGAWGCSRNSRRRCSHQRKTTSLRHSLCVPIVCM